MAPISVETDPTGRVFMAEIGSGKNDGRVMLIAADGTKYPVVTGLPSIIRADGDPEGNDDMLYADGLLYLLNRGNLYKINVANVKPGDAPVNASSLTPEDISLQVLYYFNSVKLYVKKPATPPESHPYAMCLGPDGSIYIADAAANAIFRRAKDGKVSIVTEVPGIKNPTPVGPPTIESVPTGITYDGKQFVISTLTGFPFPSGQATLYQMNGLGDLTVRKQGFNPMVDIEVDGNGGSLVLEYGTFGQTGWVAKTGRLLRVNAAENTVLFDNLNLPTDLKLAGNNAAYIVSLGDGSVQKITF